MRDHEECAAEVLQVVLKPLRGLAVQVVGRLIENQKIRRVKQYARQRNALFLTAR